MDRGAEDDTLPGSPAGVVAIYPDRGPIQAELPAPFNALLAAISEAHCEPRSGKAAGRRRRGRS